jgi:hypothetical protein
MFSRFFDLRFRKFEMVKPDAMISTALLLGDFILYDSIKISIIQSELWESVLI